MKLDIYKRAESGGRFSYLAVPEGKVLPDEVTNIDWEDAERGIEFDESGNGDASLDAYAIENPVVHRRQIKLVSVAARLLDAIHRDVRISQQSV